MSKYLVDTDVLINFFRGKRKEANFLNNLKQINVSAVSVGEIYQGVRDKQELNSAVEFFDRVNVLPLSLKISFSAVEFLKKYSLSHGLLIIDSLIGATVVENDLILLSGNKKHFQMIEELDFETWRS